MSVSLFPARLLPLLLLRTARQGLQSNTKVAATIRIWHPDLGARRVIRKSPADQQEVSEIAATCPPQNRKIESKVVGMDF